MYTGDHIGGGCYPACGVEQLPSLDRLMSRWAAHGLYIRHSYIIFYYRGKSLVETSNPNGARQWRIIIRMFILCVWVNISVSGKITHCVFTVVSDNCELLAFCLDLLQNSVFSLSQAALCSFCFVLFFQVNPLTETETSEQLYMCIC